MLVKEGTVIIIITQYYGDIDFFRAFRILKPFDPKEKTDQFRKQTPPGRCIDTEKYVEWLINDKFIAPVPGEVFEYNITDDEVYVKPI